MPALVSPTPAAKRAGLRFGTVGAHTSRTMMLAELSDLLAAVPASSRRAPGLVRGPTGPTDPTDPADATTLEAASDAAATPAGAPAAALPSRDDYVRAVLEENVLAKQTAASRRTTLQRLTELHGLDPQLAIFRVLRRLWEIDPPGRPLLAVLSALARDPLLRATAKAVLPLPPGAELSRASLYEALADVEADTAGADAIATAGAPPATAGEPKARFNAAILDKIARNTASSWAQAGHLEGRVRKLRRRVQPTPAVVAFALWLGSREDLAGDFLLRTLWARTLDAAPDELFDLALAAKQRGLLRAVSGGGVRAIDVTGLDPATESR